MGKEDKNYGHLPWNFEAFRSFISYEVLQQAASVLCLYEGKDLLESPRTLEDFEETLKNRTGIEWTPKRNVSDEVLFNVEGNVFRNKARVLTSLYLVDPQCLKVGAKLIITDFCKALGFGYLSKKQFYDTMISTYQYPHEAYDANFEAWTKERLRLKPFIFILQILAYLFQADKEQSFISVKEFAEFAHPHPLHELTKSIAKDILSNRKLGKEIKRERSDEVERKIGDLFGFLCMSGFTFYKNSLICLNLVSVHPEEKVYFYEKRGDQDVFEDLLALINKSLGRIK